ncbi:hypothetical protein CBM2633_A10379 [Cupriavidus taiwanensis]|uniref:Uncharacterized protein n=1 Tax=Cupriavidus taiwanensis TaxID=164546 RepID=A0A375E1A9_9BURK|nr:hypothetical protein CBM2615_A20096 [Cupriavidus taiwanensis]SOZ53351.1 hypothetical protein CBM2614_A20095 [Cupriavidus taiwanensis]SOZ55129.1 hypothetical protein CBM2613_A20097 [Cupriavidus taiwanensis]SOZ97560.1 hypothetical protein CBM2626_A10224 [Cupriavidus taiwanensis]SPA05429.1 hypothetical protein CBM2625_A20098 [Cupriavidus taiwanensis]
MTASEAPALALWRAAAALIARKMQKAPENRAERCIFAPLRPKKGEKRIIRIW